MKKKVILHGALALGFMAAAGGASAAFINGSIAVADGLLSLPSVPTNSIVSGLTAFDINQAQPAYQGSDGEFLSTTAIAVSDFDLNNLPTNPFAITDDGFTFRLDTANVTGVTPLACTNGLCQDAIQISWEGIVSKAGFEDTAFAGIFTGNGTCTGANGTCTAGVVGSWSGSLAALGTEPAVPVPGTLALMGIALAGFSFARRRT